VSLTSKDDWTKTYILVCGYFVKKNMNILPDQYRLATESDDYQYSTIVIAAQNAYAPHVIQTNSMLSQTASIKED
jgi:hypothetical protein